MPTNIDASTINYTPTVYWSTTTGTSTGAPITKIDLSGLTITPSNITATYNDKDEYIEKLEKHIDELEEDIEYFNKQLQEKDDKIEYLMHQVDQLESDSANMNSRLIYLESRIAVAGGQNK